MAIGGLFVLLLPVAYILVNIASLLDVNELRLLEGFFDVVLLYRAGFFLFLVELPFYEKVTNMGADTNIEWVLGFLTVAANYSAIKYIVNFGISRMVAFLPAMKYFTGPPTSMTTDFLVGGLFALVGLIPFKIGVNMSRQ